jgi:hypothetical protein
MRLFQNLTRMKPMYLFVVLLLSTALGGNAQSPASTEEAFAFVRAFFTAFDERNVTALEGMFLDGATIVHYDGVEVTIPAMLADLRAVKNWPPRMRTLSHFEAFQAGDVVVVGALNQVVFQINGMPQEVTYNETWVLQRTKGALRAIRAHYSRVTKQQHTEGGK